MTGCILPAFWLDRQRVRRPPLRVSAANLSTHRCSHLKPNLNKTDLYMRRSDIMVFVAVTMNLRQSPQRLLAAAMPMQAAFATFLSPVGLSSYSQLSS
jgi:hypothetical protein